MQVKSGWKGFLGKENSVYSIAGSREYEHGTRGKDSRQVGSGGLESHCDPKSNGNPLRWAVMRPGFYYGYRGEMECLKGLQDERKCQRGLERQLRGWRRVGLRLKDIQEESKQDLTMDRVRRQEDGKLFICLQVRDSEFRLPEFKSQLQLSPVYSSRANYQISHIVPQFPQVIKGPTLKVIWRIQSADAREVLRAVLGL